MHALSIRSPKLVLALVLLISAAFVLASVPSAHAATPIYVRTDGDDTTAMARSTRTRGSAPHLRSSDHSDRASTLVDPSGTVFVRCRHLHVSTRRQRATRLT